MTLHFFKRKLEHYAEQIRQGEHSLAATQMERYLEQGLQEESDAAHLMQAVHTYDADIKEAIVDLRQGDPEAALKKLEGLKQTLKEIKIYAQLVAKEEESLE